MNTKFCLENQEERDVVKSIRYEKAEWKYSVQFLPTNKFGTPVGVSHILKTKRVNNFYTGIISLYRINGLVV